MPHAASLQSGAPRIETIRILLVGTAPSCYNGNIGSWFASILCSARLSRGMQHALWSHPLIGHSNRFALERGRYEWLRTADGWRMGTDSSHQILPFHLSFPLF